MPIINKGTAFSNGEQLTADKLNDLVDLATFDQSATDSASTTVNTSGQIAVKDNGVSTSKIADANVTKAKIENVADYKVLGNVSGTAAAPQEVAILDEDTMSSNSATSLATQQSIKAYVDSSTPTFVPASYAGEESVTLPNGLIMKFGYKATVATNDSISFSVAFPTVCVNVSATTAEANSTARWPMKVSSLAVGGFDIKHGNGTVTNHGAYWQAIGY
jgi:hypothetical protein